jgi:hypothetical protein
VCRIVFIAVIVISLISLKGFHMIWHNWNCALYESVPNRCISQN